MMVILLNCVTLGMYQPCENIDCSSEHCQVLQVRENVHTHTHTRTRVLIFILLLQLCCILKPVKIFRGELLNSCSVSEYVSFWLFFFNEFSWRNKTQFIHLYLCCVFDFIRWRTSSSKRRVLLSLKLTLLASFFFFFYKRSVVFFLFLFAFSHQRAVDRKPSCVLSSSVSEADDVGVCHLG